MSNSFTKKLNQIEELKNQLKKEKQRLEMDIGKAFMKEFHIKYEEKEKALELIKTLAEEYHLNEEIKKEEAEKTYAMEK